MAWTPDIVMTLIECVKDNPSLYSVEDPNYKNKAVRMNILMQIAEEISVKRPGTTPEEIKKKWNIIRSTYVSERKKMLESCKSGVGSCASYKPTLYYFHSMDFLSSSLQVRVSQDSPSEFHTSSFDDGREESENSCDMVAADNRVLVPHVDDVMKTETPTRKRRRVENDKTANALRAVTSVLSGISSTAMHKDPLDIYGMHIANKLRMLNECELLDVQYEIDSIIYNTLKNRM